jgi:hypothetical protein
MAARRKRGPSASVTPAPGPRPGSSSPACSTPSGAVCPGGTASLVIDVRQGLDDPRRGRGTTPTRDGGPPLPSRPGAPPARHGRGTFCLHCLGRSPAGKMTSRTGGNAWRPRPSTPLA